MEELIKTVGYVGLFAIVFAESGLLIGFFLPGDSLLFTAGFLASQNLLSLPILLLLFAVAAITGDSVGYTFGRRVGRRLFDREDSRLFKKKHLIKAEEFYETHGSKTIILARFMPIVRTFAPIVAGIALMDYRRFVTYNIVGGILWACGVTLAGYFLGQRIPGAEKYLLPISLVIIVVSVLPSAIHVLRDDEMRGDLMNTARRAVGRAPVEIKAKNNDLV